MTRAAVAYRLELEKPECRRRGLRTICQDFEALYLAETGKQIRLVHTTLSKWADGGRTREEAGEDRALLTPPEVEVVIEFVKEIAARGWPESKRRVKEHVDLILRARLDSSFPGVGKNWVARFVLKHSDRIKMADSRPLEDKCGRGVNPATNSAWWKILLKTIEYFRITRRTTYGSDEIGVQNRAEEQERVMTSKDHKGPQYQQRAGTRDNTTVIVTICADGTALPPAVIFKGAAFQVSWGENNTIGAA
ncbi:hypothetical protein BDN72DRAFT_782304 [Pluteus cervinus]|uniref:Uncharacterized protein n=1 Tax=Pluteus cervinus TaxID=181527 RepID=A0ACD2ZYC4_9AGAR|nr:hypothetical protein BDN72DRAFT_782304 [Pluteus cervinus]